MPTKYWMVVLFAAAASISLADMPVQRHGPMRGGETAHALQLDVHGARSLVLEAEGYSWGQAVWGEARLVRADGSFQPLADLEPAFCQVGWGSFSRSIGYDGKPLQIGDRVLPHGLFAHADSRVVYDLTESFVRFEALIGINHTAKAQGSVVFTASARPMPHAVYQLTLQAGQALTPPQLAAFSRTLDHISEQQPQETALVAECRNRVERIRADLDGFVQRLHQQDPATLAEVSRHLDDKQKALSRLLDRPLLFVKRHPYMAGHIYDDYLTWHPGGGIYILENPGDPQDQHRVRPVIDPSTPETLGAGVYRDPELSWDATRVLFAFKGSQDGDTALYEIGLNGKGLRRITQPGEDCHQIEDPQGLIGRGRHDITPCYLPDGRIAFTSTRSGGLVMCFNSYIDTLHTVNPDGTDLRTISVNNVNEFDPAVLPDGRLLYGRWEYVDKTALYLQSLWTVHPDGTQETALFGNNLAKPTAILDARPVPDSPLIAATLTPHNGQAVGAIVTIDPRKGKNDLGALVNFTPEYPTEIDQGLKRGPSDPWPLTEDCMLIANNAPDLGPHGILQLIDRFGTRVTLHRDAEISCYSPMPIRPRPRPPIRPSQLQPNQPARFLVQDVYRGLDGIERGAVKKLRVVETTARVSGVPPGGRWWNQAFLVSWQGAYDVKNVLGTVPVEADGSAYFDAPPGKALYVQALDAEGRLVQSMRTFVQAAPGLTRSCSGCHLPDDDLAPTVPGTIPAALARGPSRIEPESWGHGFIHYPTDIQPILNRHCVSCHGGKEGIGGGIDLSGGWTWAFNISYETLIRHTQIGFLNCNNGSVRTTEMLPPRTHGSGQAPLATLLLDGHTDRLQNMPRVDIEHVLAWMDLNGNYYGRWDYTEHAVCGSLLASREPLLQTMEQAGCLECHQREIGHDWVNLHTPERSRILRAPLASDQALGLGWCRERPSPPVTQALVEQRHQPPDVFNPAVTRVRDETGIPRDTFADTAQPAYQAMLRIIQGARMTALQTPRVDMPGARIIPGKCRELPPLGAPVPPVALHPSLRTDTTPVASIPSP